MSPYPFACKRCGAVHTSPRCPVAPERPAPAQAATADECERVAAALDRVVVRGLERLRPDQPGATDRALAVVRWSDAARQVRALAALLAVLLALVGCEQAAALPAVAGPSCAPLDVDGGEGGAASPGPAEPPPRSFYPRSGESSEVTANGTAAIAVAACDPGDLLAVGGCRWGKRPGTVAPLEHGPIVAPDDSPIGWRCEGVATDAASGSAPGVVYATAICEVVP